jgi:uncharacterized protein with beta-barrel porin domain
LLSAGLGWQLSERVSLNTALNGEFASQGTSYSGLARLNMAF